MSEYEQLDLVELLEPLHKTKPAFLVQPWHFDESQTNPRFVAFLLDMKHEAGDRVNLYHFQIFIHKHIQRFKLDRDISTIEPMSPDQHIQFTEYLKAQAKEDVR